MSLFLMLFNMRGNGGKEKKTSEQGWGWLVEFLPFGNRCIAAKLWSDSVLLHIEPFWGPLDGMVKKRFNEILEIHTTKGHQPKQATTFQGIYLILRERERDMRDFRWKWKKQRCYQVGWAVSGFDALNSLTHINPLTPMSDRDRISPYSIDIMSSRQVVRIKKYINLGIISRSNTNFSELTL